MKKSRRKIDQRKERNVLKGKMGETKERRVEKKKELNNGENLRKESD